MLSEKGEFLFKFGFGKYDKSINHIKSLLLALSKARLPLTSV